MFGSELTSIKFQNSTDSSACRTKVHTGFRVEHNLDRVGRGSFGRLPGNNIFASPVLFPGESDFAVYVS